MISGVADYVDHLTQALIPHQHKIFVLTSKSALGEGQPSGVEALRKIERWDGSAWKIIQNQIEVWKPDLIHLQYLAPCYHNHPMINGLPFLLRGRFPNLKVVTTYHEFASPLGRLALLPLVMWSQGHIVTNDHHMAWLKKLSVLSFSKQIARIPLAANILPHKTLKERRMTTRQQLGVHAADTLLVRFGFIHDISLPEILRQLSVLKHLIEEGIPAKLLLIGKGEPCAKTRLLESLSQQGLTHHVILKTEVEAEIISAYLYAADIGLALYPDGVSEKRTAFLSLLAHDLPVIATLRQKLSGELVPEKNILTVAYEAPSDAWGKQIKRLITDESLRLRLIEAAKELSARHDWENIGRMTSDFYEQVCGSQTA